MPPPRTAAKAEPSFAERFGNKISVTNRDGSTKKLQTGEVERPAPSPRPRASMRGAKPRPGDDNRERTPREADDEEVCTV